MTKLCSKCNAPCDPWGECSRCYKVKALTAGRQCELQYAIIRELKTQTPMQLVHNRQAQWPWITIEIVNAMIKRNEQQRIDNADKSEIE